MNDYDGDTVCLIPFVKETEPYFDSIKDHTIPYYRMFKAPAQELNKGNIYNTLLLGYSNNNPGHSIGDISNAITKVWNSEELTNDKLQLIKLIAMFNNFSIDYAKTNANIVLPSNIQKQFEQLLNFPTPYFFIHFVNGDSNPNTYIS